MPADRRLFDSSAMTPPPVPEIDAVTNTRDMTLEEQHWRYLFQDHLFQDRLTVFPYEGPPRSFRESE